ncbi:hypothetical protein AB0H73_10895 [Streptomyces olivoreticuli]
MCYPEVVGQRVGFWYQKVVGKTAVWLTDREKYTDRNKEKQRAIVPPYKDFWSELWPRVAQTLPDETAAATFLLHQRAHIVFWDARKKHYAYVSIDPHRMKYRGDDLDRKPLIGLLDRRGTGSEIINVPGSVVAIVEKDDSSDWIFVLGNNRQPAGTVCFCCNTRTASGLGKFTFFSLPEDITTAYRDAAGTIIVSTPSADYTCIVRGDESNGYTLEPVRRPFA